MRLLRFLRGALLILAVLGILRIAIGAIGVPEPIGTWVTSGTLLSLILAVYYGYTAPFYGFKGYWQFIAIGWVISVTENIMVVVGILITSNLGLANYFASERVTAKRHIVGHLQSAMGGMLTIPLIILTGIAFAIGRRVSSQTATRPDLIDHAEKPDAN